MDRVKVTSLDELNVSRVQTIGESAPIASCKLISSEANCQSGIAETWRGKKQITGGTRCPECTWGDNDTKTTIWMVIRWRSKRGERWSARDERKRAQGGEGKQAGDPLMPGTFTMDPNGGGGITAKKKKKISQQWKKQRGIRFPWTKATKKGC